MQKVYSRIDWENYPSDKTPINETNLNKMDSALDEVDNRIVEQDTIKATKTEVSDLVKDISFDENTGIITVTKKNGSSITIDTSMEKIAINFDYDAETQQIVLTLIDGTKQYIDLSALITQYEFIDTDTVIFSISTDGKVSAIVKDGSITEDKLQPNYLAQIKVETAKSQTYMNNAEASAINSQSWAIGGTSTRDGEDKDNSKYYSEKSKEYMVTWKGSLLPQGSILFEEIPVSGMLPGQLYEIKNGFVSDNRFSDGGGYSHPAGTNIFWTKDNKWDTLYGSLTKEITLAEYTALTKDEKENGTIYYVTDADMEINTATESVAGIVIVDASLSSTSVNPVQNKVVSNAINSEIQRAKKIESELDTGKSPVGHKHVMSDVTDLPKFGTSATTDVSDYATAAQGAKAESAVQSVKIGNTEYKSGVSVILPEYPTKLPASDVKDWAKADKKPTYTASEVGALSSTVTHLSGDIPIEEKGAKNGVATLGSDGKVPSFQLPSYVDDVVEYDNKSLFPSVGESGKIYVDTTSDLTYRWSGSAYVEISKSIALGETSSTAYAGDKGKKNADNILALQTKINSLPSSYAPTNAQENIIETIKVNGVKINPVSKSVDISVPTKASDISAMSSSVTHLSGDVPVTREINGKALSVDITLTANDVGALPSNTPNATQSEKGLMSPSDKTKLDGISSGANSIMKELTQSQYDALSDEKKLNGTIYFITDAN